MEPALGVHKVLKLIRRAPFLNGFHFRIEHVPDSNIWPDNITLGMPRYRKDPIRRVTSTLPLSGVTISPDFLE